MAGPQETWDEKAGKLEERLGVRFRDRGLLRTAMTHSSYRNEAGGAGEDNERLEFLGDAVVGFVVGDFLFRRKRPVLSEGQLTRTRAELVREESLAAAARRMGLGEALLLGRGESGGGGRGKPSILASAFEAVVGAVYLDQGIRVAFRFVRRQLDLPDLAARSLDDGRDPKTRLQEWVQKSGPGVPEYTVTGVEGPPHDRLFAVELRVGGELLGTGRGKSKKAAEQEAARVALLRAFSGPEMGK